MRTAPTPTELNQKLVAAAKLIIAVLEPVEGISFEGDECSTAEIVARLVHLANLRFGSEMMRTLVDVWDQHNTRYLQGLCVECGEPWQGEGRTCQSCQKKFTNEHFPHGKPFIKLTADMTGEDLIQEIKDSRFRRQ